jgi:cytochrome c-type biogenesis protein CcmH/NrfF
MERVLPALLVLAAVAALARAETAPPLTAQARQRRFACLCSMCTRRPLDACACKNAEAMRTQLGLLVAQLSGDGAKIDLAMAEKYGAAVLEPIPEATTSSVGVPWLGPLVLGTLGAGVLWRVVRVTRRRRQRS